MASDHSQDPYDLLWTIGFIIAIVLIAWWFAGEHVMNVMLRLKAGQLWLQNELGLGNSHTQQLYSAVLAAVQQPATVTFEQFTLALNHTGYYWRWPVIALLLGVALWIGFFNSSERFRKQMDLRSLAETMGEHWPFALHALRRNQLDIALDHPRWGMALDQWRFAKKHQLLVADDAEPVAETAYTLETQRARQVFAQQLGLPTQTWQALPLHRQALAGLLAQRVVSLTTPDDHRSEQLKDASYQGLRQLAWAAANNKKNDFLPSQKDFTAIVASTQECLAEAAITDLAHAHAYQLTFLMRLLAEARRNGILATALFNWLKGLDRPLWYALNTVGRREPFVEAAGVFAHYQAERQVSKALAQAVIEPAVVGLETAINRSRPPENLNPMPSEATREDSSYA